MINYGDALAWCVERIRRIRLLLQYRRCERDTNHAQANGSAFCRCCWKLYPLNEQTREIFWRERESR